MTDPAIPNVFDRPIIIIDDDREDLDLTKELAKIIGISNEVIAFVSPVTALDYLVKEQVSPLFIVCDVNMPKLDGFQFRSELLEKVPGIEKIPFFFLSTSKSSGEVRLAEEFGATGYYQKPNSFEDQKEIIKEMWTLSANG